ncbi:cuticle collagen 13-like [Canis lupus dingo]|uniref:cuticle collagen 13-like n=1 Tax=Canis lupus dingo TaxID=286419 RepID=UPI0006B3CB79|nr:cuticle collagen 13-like [Canis lupus dingo]
MNDAERKGAQRRLASQQARETRGPQRSENLRSLLAHFQPRGEGRGRRIPGTPRPSSPAPRAGGASAPRAPARRPTSSPPGPRGPPRSEGGADGGDTRPRRAILPEKTSQTTGDYRSLKRHGDKI